jgi:hypothetical protein
VLGLGAIEQEVVIMGAAASTAFWAGVAVGAAARDVVNDAIDSVYDAAEAVMDYLRTVASSAWEKLKAAAEFVKARVIKLVRRLRGRKEAAAARREVDSAAAADVWTAASQQASFRPGSHPGPRRPKSADAWEWEPRSRQAPGSDPNMPVVLSRAAARVTGFGRLQDVKAGLPPPSSAIVSATAPGGELALPGSVADPAARAGRRASEMMALLETDVAALGDSIPEAARSYICVVVAAVGIGLEAIAAAALDA